MTNDPLAQELELQKAEEERLAKLARNLNLSEVPKVHSEEEMSCIASEFGDSGKRLVITSGCFDILHSGHKLYLPEARACGDALLIALNADESVRQQKGPERPVRTAALRAYLLAELECVDYITVFPDYSLARLIHVIKPQVYAKGGDYTIDTIHQDLRASLEKEEVECRFLSNLEGVSTTRILQRQKQT